jgi:hypothetical protein
MTSVIRHLGSVAVVAAAVFTLACGGRGANDAGLTEVRRVKSGDLDIVLLSDDGALNQGKEAFVIEFRRADGSLVDAGTVTTSANMLMPGMTMPGSVSVEPGDAPGRYRATGDFGMAGAWQMKVDWNGPSGQGSVSFDGTVQ